MDILQTFIRFFRGWLQLSINYIFYTLMESRRLYGKSVADAEWLRLHFFQACRFDHMLH